MSRKEKLTVLVRLACIKKDINLVNRYKKETQRT